MQDPAPAGSRVVSLDASTLVPLDMGLNQRGLAQTLRYGPSPLPVGDPRYTTATLTFGSVGLRPFSVSQIAGRRALPAADVLFTWVRRTRFAGDSWDPDTVPLNEDVEAYDLEIVGPGGTVVRTVPGLSSPAWTYTAAAQTADFGAPQSSYRLNVYQLSALVGRGQAASRVVFL